MFGALLLLVLSFLIKFLLPHRNKKNAEHLLSIYYLVCRPILFNQNEWDNCAEGVRVPEMLSDSTTGYNIQPNPWSRVLFEKLRSLT
jgi:hypothetical protein